MENLKKLALIPFISGILFSQAAYAATTTATIAVSATVIASCTVAADATLGFGSYTMGVLDNTTTISVTCTNGTTYNIGFNAGLGSGATTSNRLMTKSTVPTGTLPYALYRDSGRTQNWGNTVGTDTVAGTGSGITQTYTVYGRILADRTAQVGAGYTDTVTITVTF